MGGKGKIDSSPARGMRDVLPDEVELRDHARAVIVETYRQFGYAHVETPALENIALLAGSEGGENEKLIYKVLKRGKKLDLAKSPLDEADLVDLGLRYDLTVPLARYYAHNQGKLPQPFKAIQIGSVWRAERPQRGRYRQFTQCDIDVLGEASVLAEIDLIVATTSALRHLGLADFTVRINDRGLLSALASSCGFAEDRHDAVFIALDKLDKAGWEGVTKELLEAGHAPAAVSSLQERLETLAASGGAVIELPELEVPELFARLTTIQDAVLSHLGTAGRVLFDPTLARGMGYYTGPIFEVGVEGLPFSIAGGGRYDRMVGRMLGRDVPACGFSIGFERLIMLLEEKRARGAASDEHRATRVALLCDRDGGGLPAAFERARELRHEGCWVSVVTARKKLGKQLDELQAAGFDGWVSPEHREPRWFERPQADGSPESRSD